MSHDPSPESLTRCERQVVALLAHGLRMAEAARLLHKARSTVDSHRQSAHHKLRIHDRVSLVRWAIRHGIDQSTPVKARKSIVLECEKSLQRADRHRIARPGRT